MIFHNIVRINGAYDIVCGLNLLKIISVPYLDNLHTQMFVPSILNNEFASRVLGYWIITYGVIRLCAEKGSPLISLSYYLETLCLLNEVNYHPLYVRLFFTAVLSSYFGHINVLMDLKDVRK